MPSKNAAAAETALVEKAENRQKAEDRARKARRSLYAQMDKAQNSGVTYVRIAEICNVSAARVGQILASVRAGEMPE